MASATLTRGARILRSAPWLPILGSTGVAGLLLGIAVLVHRTDFASFATLLGLSACGAAAAYALDEESADVADATPTSRGRRVVWRLQLVALPAVVAIAGLLMLNSLDSSTHWLRLVPLALGSMAIGLGLAAGLRRGSTGTPGDLAGVVTVASTILLVAADPLRRWVSVIPLGEARHVGRSVLLWMVVIAMSAAVTLRCSRDPAQQRREW